VTRRVFAFPIGKLFTDDSSGSEFDVVGTVTCIFRFRELKNRTGTRFNKTVRTCTIIVEDTMTKRFACTSCPSVRYCAQSERLVNNKFPTLTVRYVNNNNSEQTFVVLLSCKAIQNDVSEFRFSIKEKLLNSFQGFLLNTHLTEHTSNYFST